MVLSKLEERERQFDGQRVHRVNTGFLSRTREEHEAEVLGSKITMLVEDNEGLKSEKDELEKANKGVNAHMTKLRDEKSTWQKNIYFELLENHKRPRDGGITTEPAEAKRRVDSASHTSPTISERMRYQDPHPTFQFQIIHQQHQQFKPIQIDS
jgi:hypothetical protein